MQPFDYQFTPIALPPLLTAAALFALTVAIPIRERRSRTSLFFGLLTLLLALWLGAFGMMYLSRDAETAMRWCRAGYLAIPFIPAALYHFTLRLIGKYQQQRFYVWLSWALSLFFAEQLARTGSFLAGVERHWFGFYPRFDVGGAVFVMYFVIPLLASTWHLWMEHRGSGGERQRGRARAVFPAYLIGYLAVVDFLPAFGLSVYPFGWAAILSFAFLSTAAIRRYRLVTITPALAAQQIIDTMSGGVIVTDNADTVTVANRAAMRMLGYSEREIIGLHISRILPDLSGPTSPRLLRNQSMSWRRKDGSTVEVRVSASMLAPRGDLPAGIVYTALDVSELKQAEGEVKKSVSLLQSTLESTTDGILVIDLQGKIVLFNHRFLEMWGIPPDIANTGDDSRAVEFVLNQLENPAQFVERISELYAHPEAESFDTLQFKDGRIFERYSIPQRLEDRPIGRVWSFRDVTDRERAEESLRRRDEIMQAVSFAAEQFLRSPNWRDSISVVLEQLGRATHVSHVYLFQRHIAEDGRELFSERAEWADQGTQRFAGDPRFQSLPVLEDFRSWVERLNAGEVIQGTTDHFSGAARDLLQTHHQALILVPIMIHKNLWGVVGLSHSRAFAPWAAVEVEALKAAAEILGAAIQRQDAAEALQASEVRYQLLFERNLAGVFRSSLHGKILECNDACAYILGYSSREEILARGAYELYFDPAERERYVRHLLERRALTNVELRLRRRDGTPVWVLENVSLLVEEGGEPVLEGTLIDITDRKVAEQQIEFQAYHDALTGLPNRMLFQDRLTVALAHAHRLKLPVAVMFLDLDHFKFVNDTLGHTVGDLLLKGVARRLTDALREEDTVARLGGDEFTLLLAHLSNEEDAAKIAQKLLEAIATPFLIESHDLYVTTSIGIAMYPVDGEDAETLLKNADSAMYRAKELGRNTYQLCTPSMNRRALERLSMETSLRRALDRQEFTVFYQPQVNLTSGQIVGTEALLRWRHPERGIVLPTEFIGITEDTRLIYPLGDWVLREACRQTRAWRRDFGCAGLRVAVNLSARQFQQRDLVKSIDRALSEVGLEPACLELEITEGVAMQNTEYTIAVMRELKAMGILIAMDDFGTGHSSLNYLKRFPIDTIKIDQGFIRDLRIGSDAAIVIAMMRMAQGMKLRVVAEGVETNEQLDFLRTNGCEVIQGFLFSAPKPAEEIAPLLRAAAQPITRPPNRQ